MGTVAAAARQQHSVWWQRPQNKSKI